MASVDVVDVRKSYGAHEVIHGSAFDVHCPVETVSLLYLNPPFDFEWGEDHPGRMEKIFLEQCFRWLKPGGVLVFVLPGQRLSICDRLLATHFKDKRVYRLSAPDCTKYGQVVVFGARRTRRERDRLPVDRHHLAHAPDYPSQRAGLGCGCRADEIRWHNRAEQHRR